MLVISAISLLKLNSGDRKLILSSQIVDTTRYHYDDADEKERELDFVKVLLGAIDEGIDKMERRATNTAGDWDPN